MGVFPYKKWGNVVYACLPHARGGVSSLTRFSITALVSSPRPWGCFSLPFSAYKPVLVFPTPVGVFRTKVGQPLFGNSLPHARGGVSRPRLRPLCRVRSSPRPWGCFRSCALPSTGRSVFPTPVGVFLAASVRDWPCASLPHARGGVSSMRGTRSRGATSSPRPWGCFFYARHAVTGSYVFPTPVGVFLHDRLHSPEGAGLPHARGGVSLPAGQLACAAPSSPRPWGCFCPLLLVTQWVLVFPTPVGVFPPTIKVSPLATGLPHARGGVSAKNTPFILIAQSSPRPWGCFLRNAAEDLLQEVFPTPVGVFL